LKQKIPPEIKLKLSGGFSLKQHKIRNFYLILPLSKN